ncbi:uncharacterized protein LOC111346365 [Stylophora pistillata]|uniref:uncharacterized protein LOC111346365 n=1 Tax=Stylophora pistillata TaxID=50429 RepID=UPI000C04D059|nr:uncharacterized protein LOC111346365 [Stylophora pistillata]
MQEQGLINPIIEIDLATESIDWEKFTTEDVCQLLTERFKWSRAYLSPDAKILVNLRDFPDAMVYEMERLFTVVDYLASRPAAERPFAIMFEEPTGKFLPEEVGAWTAGVRKIMDSHEWTSGHLLAHVHKKWALGEMVQLECLVNGANGIWASLCEEGANAFHYISAYIPDKWVLPCLEFGPNTITSDLLSGITCLITVACRYPVRADIE